MFLGESDHTLDDKGRVFVPKRFQELFGHAGEQRGVAFLTRGQDRCVMLFTEQGFRAALADLHIAAFDDEEGRAAARLLFSNTSRVEFDASGRVLVGEKLRALAGLAGVSEVVVVGAMGHAELWERGAWLAYQQANEHVLERIHDVLGRPGRPGGD